MFIKSSLLNIHWFGSNLFEKKFSYIYNKFIKKYYLRKLIINIKAYNKLKSNNNLLIKKKLLLELEKVEINIDKYKLSSLIFGNNHDKADKIIKQNIMYYFVQDSSILLFTSKLLKSILKNSKIYHPLPKEYHQTFKSFNLNISEFGSNFNWFFFILIFYFFGIYKIFKTIILSFKNNKYKKFQNYNNSVYFFYLNKHSLPQNDSDYNKKNIINWFDDKESLSKNILNIYHDVKQFKKINYKKYKIQYLSNLEHLYELKYLLKFILWAIKVTILCFYDLFRGRWWHALLLHEAVDLKIVSLNKKKLFNKYFFNNSLFIKRPLWTYYAEENGSEILFYFYSTNSQNYTTIKDKDPTPFGWRNTTWNNYLIWDKYQEKFLKNYTFNKKNIKAYGPIWFSDINTKFNKPKLNFITVFDISPARDVFNKTYIVAESFPNYAFIIKFLNDIVKICEKNDIIMVLKIKRTLTNIHHPKYIKFLNNFNLLNNTILLNPETSSSSIIEQSSKVISAPFCSPSIVAKNLNISSIYYDPLSIYLKNNPVAHNIEIIRGKDMLEKWIIS